MLFNLEVVTNFTDKHDKSIKYVQNDIIKVDLERAIELLSNQHHLVRVISIENISESISEENKNKIIGNFFESAEVETVINYLSDEIKNKIIEEYLKNVDSDIDPIVSGDTAGKEETNSGNLGDTVGTEETDPTGSGNTEGNEDTDSNESKELSNKSFKELQEIAKSKDIDVAGLTKKELLIQEILKK